MLDKVSRGPARSHSIQFCREKFLWLARVTFRSSIVICYCLFIFCGSSSYASPSFKDSGQGSAWTFHGVATNSTAHKLGR